MSRGQPARPWERDSAGGRYCWRPQPNTTAVRARGQRGGATAGRRGATRSGCHAAPRRELCGDVPACFAEGSWRGEERPRRTCRRIHGAVPGKSKGGGTGPALLCSHGSSGRWRRCSGCPARPIRRVGGAGRVLAIVGHHAALRTVFVTALPRRERASPVGQPPPAVASRRTMRQPAHAAGPLDRSLHRRWVAGDGFAVPLGGGSGE